MKRRLFSRILLPSTRAFFRAGRAAPDYSLFDFLHGYVYGRWPYLYIGIGTGEHPLARLFGPVVRTFSRFFASDSDDDGERSDSASFADTYHGKVVPLDAATQLVTVDQEVSLTDLEHIIPYARARDIILQNPDQIVVIECPCRAIRPDPCLPLDVCLLIGEPFASFVLDHHPRRARRIAPAEAVEILEATDERGHVHHAFFKDAMLNRFYAICNCCSCCCGAMNAWSNGTPMLVSSGYVCQADYDLCIGCDTCVDYCQFSALELVDGVVVVDEAACMGCGVCISKCDQEALALERDPARAEPLEIRQLMGV